MWDGGEHARQGKDHVFRALLCPPLMILVVKVQGMSVGLGRYGGQAQVYVRSGR